MGEGRRTEGTKKGGAPQGGQLESVLLLRGIVASQPRLSPRISGGCGGRWDRSGNVSHRLELRLNTAKRLEAAARLVPSRVFGTPVAALSLLGSSAPNDPPSPRVRFSTNTL